MFTITPEIQTLFDDSANTLVQLALLGIQAEAGATVAEGDIQGIGTALTASLTKAIANNTTVPSVAQVVVGGLTDVSVCLTLAGKPTDAAAVNEVAVIVSKFEGGATGLGASLATEFEKVFEPKKYAAEVAAAGKA